MQALEYRTVDKSDWGPGPWQHEPDKKQWRDEATGFPCLIVRGLVGALCGYVGVPAGHRYHGAHYGAVDVSAHGGLTFADKCAPHPTPEAWERWRAGAYGRREEAKRSPRGDAARRLKERGGELEDYDAYVRWVVAAKICHIPSEGEPDDVWWLGFDCAHAGDLSPILRGPALRDAGYTPSDRGDVYRDMAFVETEVKRLASQLV